MKKHILLLCYLAAFIGFSAVFNSHSEAIQKSPETQQVASEKQTEITKKKFSVSPEMQKALDKSVDKQQDAVLHSDGLTSSERIIKYVKSGIVHIVPMGVDHILFVLGLFLVAATMKQLFLQITLFTLAHSVTLGLAASGYIGLSSSVVEPLIALSIAYIAYENIVSPEPKRSRLLLIFVFGLLHGLGFAFVLQEFGIPSDSFLMALFAFNIGVEIGHLSVIVFAFVLLSYWRDKPSYRMFVQIPLSIVIGLVGVYWTFERVFM